MESNSHNTGFEVLCCIAEESGLVTLDAVLLDLYYPMFRRISCTSVTTGLWDGSFPAWARSVILFCNVQTCCAAYPASHSLVTGVLSRDVKLPGREVGHLHLRMSGAAALLPLRLDGVHRDLTT